MPPQAEHSFTITIEDFDVSLLPPDARRPDTPRFQEAVNSFLQAQFEGFQGRARILVDEKQIHVTWQPGTGGIDLFDQVVARREKGEYPESVPLLKLILSSNPDDPNVLYNLGMALCDLGKPGEAEEHLKKAAKLASDHQEAAFGLAKVCLLYTSPSPRDRTRSRMPSSA